MFYSIKISWWVGQKHYGTMILLKLQTVSQNHRIFEKLATILYQHYVGSAKWIKRRYSGTKIVKNLTLTVIIKFRRH